jgi:translation initiation factor eIF-2B subunit delta
MSSMTVEQTKNDPSPTTGAGGGNKKPQQKNEKKIQNKENKGAPAAGAGAGAASAPAGKSGSGQSGNSATTPRSDRSARGNVTTAVPRLALFDHLHKPRDPKTHNTTIQTDPEVHPAIEKFGLLTRNGLFTSDDDRAVAFLMAIYEVIESYTTPQSVALKNDLLRLIKHQVNYLVQTSRVHSLGMGNIIKYIYYILSQVPPELSEADAKSHLVNELKLFSEEKITLARQSICRHFQEIVKDGEVIVTYGSSPLIRSMLLSLLPLKRMALKIIIIDSMPHWEGLRTLQALQCSRDASLADEDLSSHGSISFSYAPLSGAANAIKDASRVILGASGLLVNGSAFAPAGTGMIACLAHFYRIPVIFAAESYKFTDRVQMDSIIYNELSDPLQLMKLAQPPPAPVSASSSQRENNQQPPPQHAIYLPLERHGETHLSTTSSSASEAGQDQLLPPRVQLLNVNYDLTPIHNVSAILTEVGLIPPTSVPVLLRELRYDVNGN